MSSTSKIFIIFGILSPLLYASVTDEYHLYQAYKRYKTKEYNRSIEHLKKIDTPSLQSKMALADSYYQIKKYKKAIAIYKSVHSNSVTIKQQLYYNIANAYVKLLDYDHAKGYYAKVLQLGEDEDARYNLSLIALLSSKKEGELGIAQPKSQTASASKSNEQSDKETKNQEEKPSGGSGGDGKSSKTKNKKKGEKLMSNHKEEKHPLSSKVYELINEGYIYEKQPW